MTSYLVWIPSIQNYLRFKELSWNQLKSIIKSIDDIEIEFIYQLNAILKTNLVDSSLDVINKLTILDRFVIFLTLKIHSCGPYLSLTLKCEKCNTVIKNNTDLNLVIEKIKSFIDIKFTNSLTSGNYTILCDMPSIGAEYEIHKINSLYNLNKASMDMNIDNYLLSHIQEIYIKNIPLNINSLTYNDRVNILNQIPSVVINKIDNDFINAIHRPIKDISFVSFICEHKKCKHESNFKFSFTNINDFLKIIYRDFSVEKLLSVLSEIAISTKLGGTFLADLSPIELDILSNLNQQQSPEPKQEEDLFAKNLPESKGEFS